jgi:hypothetical protein
MENTKASYALVFVTIASILPLSCSNTLANSKNHEMKVNMETERKSYIVYMEKSMKPDHFSLHQHWYTSLIDEVLGSNSDPTAILYTYDIVTHGFAAKMTSAKA